MATDVLDGWIAVRFNQRSTLGLYLDPVVDKIVLLAMFYELARASLLPWAVPHLFLARELLQNGVRTVAATRGETVGANWMGKAKAFLQTILISWGLAMPALEKSSDESFYSCLSFSFTLSCILVLALAWVFFGVFVYWNRRRISTDMNA